MVNTKVEIDGIKYHLGLGFLNEITEGTGKSLIELGSMNYTALNPLLMYYSRLYACKRNNEKVDFTLDDVYDYIDEKGGLVGDICVEFIMAYRECMKNHIPSDDKKKAKAVKK